MRRASRGLKGVLRPKPEDKTWVDVLMLVIFGPWFLVGIVSLFQTRSGSNAYACSGPGFADFGCTGGTEAIVAHVLFALFMTFLFSVSLVAIVRIINR